MCPPCCIWSRQNPQLLKKSVDRMFDKKFYPIVFSFNGFKSPPEILDCFQPLQSLEVYPLLMEYFSCCTLMCFWLITWRLDILSLPWFSRDNIFWFCFAIQKHVWASPMKPSKRRRKRLCGDILLTAAFVSYFGPFKKQYHQEPKGQIFPDSSSKGTKSGIWSTGLYIQMPH